MAVEQLEFKNKTSDKSVSYLLTDKTYLVALSQQSWLTGCAGSLGVFTSVQLVSLVKEEN